MMQLSEKMLTGRMALALGLLLAAMMVTSLLAAKPATAEETGRVLAWGDNHDGQLGNGTSGPNAGSNTPVGLNLYEVKSAAGGCQHSLALKNDGTVWAWGQNFSDQLGDGTNTLRSTPVQVKGPGENGVLTDVEAI